MLIINDILIVIPIVILIVIVATSLCCQKRVRVLNDSIPQAHTASDIEMYAFSSIYILHQRISYFHYFIYFILGKILFNRPYDIRLGDLDLSKVLSWRR